MACSVGVVVITSALHAVGHGFETHTEYFYFFVTTLQAANFGSFVMKLKILERFDMNFAFCMGCETSIKSFLIIIFTSHVVTSHVVLLSPFSIAYCSVALKIISSGSSMPGAASTTCYIMQLEKLF